MKTLILSTVARSLQLDNKIKAYIQEHPYASVVNPGAGLETAFYRVDNGTIRWYDLDFPKIIEIRKQLLPETDRTTCIAKSFLDPCWYQDIDPKNGLFIMKDMMISALTTSTRPQSIEWNDFEIWRNQLSALEKGKAMSDFFTGFSCGSPLEDAKEIIAWDNRITVIDQFPLFKNIMRDPLLSRSIRQFMDYTDEKGRIKIIHLRFKNLS